MFNNNLLIVLLVSFVFVMVVYIYTTRNEGLVVGPAYPPWYGGWYNGWGGWYGWHPRRYWGPGPRRWWWYR